MKTPVAGHQRDIEAQHLGNIPTNMRVAVHNCRASIIGHRAIPQSANAKVACMYDTCERDMNSIEHHIAYCQDHLLQFVFDLLNLLATLSDNVKICQ
jgi:hypothetical protein